MHHYDVLPYESNPFRETHPAFLAPLGRLFGVSTAEPASCRVLELGCAGGGNLIPMAWRLPDSEFVGIDLEAAQIADGMSLVEELGLANIRLLQGDILKLAEDAGSDLGRFDYIIAHGVYSWVPPAVREALMTLCRRLLTPNGLAYISYNTKPGWHVRGLLREVLLYHVRDVEDPVERLNRAGEMVELLHATFSAQDTLMAQHLAREAGYLRTVHPSYLYHEYLESYNEPVLVSEFLDQAQRHGLRYLCETQLYTMFASSLGPQVEAFLEQFEDQAVHEQYLDLFSQRHFRQSLLCHAAVEPDYEIDLNRFDDFACHANLVPPGRPMLRRASPETFTTHGGKSVQVAEPIAKAMLSILHARFPDAVAMPELQAQAEAAVQAACGKQPVPPAGDWRGEWFNLYANGLVGLSTHAVNPPAPDLERPRLDALARAQLRRGSRNLTTRWHESLNTDAFSRHLAACFDGTRDRNALIDTLVADLDAGRLELPDLKGSPAQRRAAVASNLDRILALFARSGILDATQ